MPYSRFPARREASHETDRVGKAEPDIGGGGRGAGFTDQNGTSAAVASPPTEPRTPLNARVHAYSADQMSDSVRPQMEMASPPQPPA